MGLGPQFSIIIPAYNEVLSIGSTLKTLSEEAGLSEAEIIVVDDGSKDGTAEIAQQFSKVRLIRHTVNMGYGSSLRTGIRAAKGTYIAWFDADGQHRVQDLLAILNRMVEKDLEYCIGIRDANSYQDPSRVVGKVILKAAVRFAAGTRVNDFNSGLRAFRRDVIMRYLHLLPKKFGASTLTTLIMIERNHLGDEVAIKVEKRIGKSTVNQLRDGLRSLLLILRIFLLFKPLQFFGLVGIILILLGGVYGVAKSIMVGMGFPVLSSILITLGFQSFFFGLLCDQISALRIDRLDS